MALLTGGAQLVRTRAACRAHVVFVPGSEQILCGHGDGLREGSEARATTRCVLPEMLMRVAGSFPSGAALHMSRHDFAYSDGFCSGVF
jgi:hypothetical protein